MIGCSSNPRAARRCLAAACTLIPSCCSAVFGQSSTRPADEWAHGLRLLQNVHDNVFTFDDPAFYWFCKFVKSDADQAKYDVRSDHPALPWRFLLERPSDHRGQLVTIEGTLLSRYEYDVTNRAGAGTLYQCELGDPGTRAICTVVVIEPPGEIPIRSRVKTKGYFIKVRAFRTDAGESGAGPLIVSRRLDVIEEPEEGSGVATWSVRGGRTWLIVATAALVIIWLVLRRRLGARPGEVSGSSRKGLRKSPSDDDFDWLSDTEEPNKPDDAAMVDRQTDSKS